GGGGGGGGSGSEEDLSPGADGERWPDRYVWDIVVKASRLESLLRMLMTLLPGRVYPIVDVLGNDAYREIDPYVAYDLVGQERFFDVLRRFRGFFLEDGMVGFGAMSDEPFVYVFVDEHKIVTVRAETRLKERVERILAAFELKQVESLAGADAAPHEHRTVLDAPGDRPDLLTSDEVLEAVRDEWGLTLNVNPERNLDDRGRPLGICPWRCVVRMIDEKGDVRYREMLLSAGNLVDAEGLAMEDTISGAEAEPPAPGGSGSGRRTPVRGRRPGLTGSGSGSGEGAEATEEKEQGEKKEGEAAGPEGGGEEEPRALDLIVADRLRKEDFRKALSTAAAGEPAAGAVKKGQRVDSGLVERALKLDQARVWAARWLA
ncbi:MAG: hypothetical protein IOD15_06535, partial [Phycisphaerales bacterium]|nr:hypothetical protein [Phycisphaerales bacterium]